MGTNADVVAGDSPEDVRAALAAALRPLTTERPAPKGMAPAEIQARIDALGLPLNVTWPADAKKVMIFVSGDGGWQDLDAGVTTILAAHGVAVVGWSSLSYFWEEKTEEQFRTDLRRLLDALPDGVEVIAGGYSFGAEIIPIALQGTPVGSEARVGRFALIAPGQYAAFEVHPTDWLHPEHAPSKWSVPDALRLQSRPSLCIKATDETDTGCPDGVSSVKIAAHGGGHHFDGDYPWLADAILGFAR